jgi:phenylalanyl-tRNA synthetase alpha chain
MSGMDIEGLKVKAEQDIQRVVDAPGLEEFRAAYLGRKGALAQLTATIPSLPKEERAGLGQRINALKASLSQMVEEKERGLRGGAEISARPPVDIGMPAVAQEVGHLHPLTLVMDEILDAFTRMGFLVIEGPEIETEHNNFTGLNIPLEHPSRDAFDTFYLPYTSAGEGKLLLRSQTSPVQIRAMKTHKPPLAVASPGRVYRPDAVDASHSFMFHQIEGFIVDEGITFSHLKGILEVFAKSMFGEKIKMRFRPHYFPFTEPSAEMDISCFLCQGRGCSVCGRKGWLEVLGSGMIHPNVFTHVGYDPEKYTGFAFGMGVERIAMLKYGIDDIRIFYENDLRVLRQF